MGMVVGTEVMKKEKKVLPYLQNLSLRRLKSLMARKFIVLI